ncbi:response regulator [Bosea rubneri]|uniref:Response regulator n=1 Tax=Bosea rubneri TaxID=3075434 RepID=A0ABU3SEL0_9HYPH|nr:response regulator [Bosea sp. ZW T0_25]MDU0343214.1 response regulator [Bosea sp. ZW T0_25]
MNKPIALIVEDEPLLMLHAVDIVEDAGFEVLEAANADEAVVILEGRDDIRVVITDVQMPGTMDGLKLANAVRDRWPPILIIVVPGHHKLQAGELPDDVRFLTKPYSERQMHEALSQLI